MGIYHLDSSARTNSSVTRQFSELTVTEVKKYVNQDVIYRDLGRGEGLKFVDNTIVGGLFTPESQRSPEQKEALKASDKIIEEAMETDIWVIGLPIYNFSMPATFKTWADMLARVRKTFQYTENGPEGLLKNKKVIAIIASGGTMIDSEIDFCTPWLRHFFKFLGINDLTIIKADQYNQEKQIEIEKEIQKVVKTYANY